MLYVKIMSGEDMDDTNPYKNYTIVPIQGHEVMQFVANPNFHTMPEDGPQISRYQLLVHGPDGGNETHDLSGNAYVMTESGKTISSHGC